ncbi:MAG: 4Fe-4S dicluster domain-containing protein [Eggerthellaceae bacterium]|nr:4Fe-4S dicluster domain-containing protein [Eggerthellaceae bacterium]
MNNFIEIKPDVCIGCGTCRAACSVGHERAGLQAEPRLAMVRTGSLSASVTCHHCEGAPCSLVCPVGAITKENGSVHINEQTCVGCRLCACVCPFGAIHPSGTSIAGVAGIKFDTPTFPKATSSLLTWEIGVYTRAVKCDLCAYDPEGGPHCVAACPTGALSFHDAARDARVRTEKRVAAAEANEVVMRDLSTIRRP